MKDKKNSSNCEFAESIVTYMYGELPIGEQEDFEAHLKDCQLCIDEFAVISEARFSVYQWQRSEFAPLETPEIRIPIKVAANIEISWFNKLRAAFSSLPLAFAAGLIAVFAVGFVVFRATQVQNTPEVAESTIADSDSGSERAADQTQQRASQSFDSSMGSEQKRRGETQDNAEVKVAATEPTRPYTVNVSKSNRPLRASVPKSLRQTQATTARPAKNRTVPQMNDFAEEDDNSLRLAELFDDVDTIY